MNARQTALQILCAVYDDGAYANIALNKYLVRHELKETDRRFITELVYGTIKAGDTLLWILQQYSKIPIKKIHPIIRSILRMGIYQLVFMDKIPASAACNESVKLAKKYGHPGTVKFVNAILRAITRNSDKCDFNKVSNDKISYLALKYWHPRWLVKLLINEFGIEQTENFCQFNNTDPPLSFRCNTLKNNPAELLEQLTQKGFTCYQSALCQEGIICTKHPSLVNLMELQTGQAIIQDVSSMLVAHVLDPQKDDFIIDMCSAPGGKTTHIATLLENTGTVLANDIYEHKIKLITDNASRLNLHNIKTNIADARLLGNDYKYAADKVLADVPCSGLGVLRRKADARWNKTAADIEKLPQLQYEILESAAKAVKHGGILIYSTCTILKRENTAVIERFLTAHDDFSIDPIDAFLPQQLRGRGNMLQLLPPYDDTDGFFIARLKRIK
jgi:16S rRNA (cytosine967-C5)-methyltransferase